MPAPNAQNGDLICWQESLSVGNAQLDRQHQDILAQLNRLHRDWLNPAPSPDLSVSLDILTDLIALHMVDEEQILDKAQAPSLRGHKLAHRALWAELAQLAHEAQFGPTRAGLNHLKAFACKMVQDHLQGWDLPARRYFEG